MMSCHPSEAQVVRHTSGVVALIGHPNVGKSALFHKLTGQRVMVSNYPGTTVEVTRGTSLEIPNLTFIDTPGIITFPPHSEDEVVTVKVLFDEPVRAILQVGDAKNLRRTLYLTIQLMEMGLPMVLALNMIDEAQDRGVAVDIEHLEEALNLIIVPTAAVLNQGIDQLKEALLAAQAPRLSWQYPHSVESLIHEFAALLREAQVPPPPLGYRALALAWLSGDVVAGTWMKKAIPPEVLELLEAKRSAVEEFEAEPLSELIRQARLQFIDTLVQQCLITRGRDWQGFSARLSHFTLHPFWGLVTIFVVLYAMYLFVGVFGAGTLVGLLEEKLFGEVINPWMIDWVRRLIPISGLSDFFVGAYGLWTMGVTYAIALILPIVTTFFLAFGILEDSGYLPRLAAFSNRLFRAMGLNGRAVLPMILGLGCVTMATVTTRVLDSKRDRLLVILLLALAVPCSAQMGVVVGMLAGISFAATAVWGLVIFLVLVLVGWLAARLLPGERAPLFVELPPLRWPRLSNILLKTAARLEWYLKEVVPVFLIGTAAMFLLDKSGLLAILIKAAEPLVSGWLGLPPQASAAFIMGFMRRDFGATGLFVMESQGLLSPLQVLVAMVTVTLFIPCVASVLMIAKENGWKVATGVVLTVIPLAFGVGGVLYRILQVVGWP